MNETPAASGPSPDGPPKPKKSVALSGVVAGNTALCTVGRTGNDLHYRGYDILDLAETCEFEEVAYLLVHGKLPDVAELRAYKTKLKALRGLPAAVRSALEALPAATHPMDVLRTGVSALGCALPERGPSRSWGTTPPRPGAALSRVSARATGRNRHRTRRCRPHSGLAGAGRRRNGTSASAATWLCAC